MHAALTADVEGLRGRLAGIRGGAGVPDASVVVPVNAASDIKTALTVVDDISRYRGDHCLEVVLVINNYPPGAPPPEIEELVGFGVEVVAVPSVYRPDEVISFSARIPGLRAAKAPFAVMFDADCRISSPTSLIDWYLEVLGQGAGLAYTRVGYYDLKPMPSVRARIAAHHAARWVKRNLLRIPTSRGSNYAVDRALYLDLYDRRLLADDLNSGPTVKASGRRVVYGSDPRLTVLTSGRRFQGGWRKLARYLMYRFRYNRAMLPVRHNSDRMTTHPAERYPNAVR